MKKIMLLTIAIAMVVTANAKVNDNDTVVVENPNRVTVVTTDSLQSVRIEGKKGDPGFTYQSKIELTDSNYTSTSAINSHDFSYSIGPLKKCSNSDERDDVTGNFFVGFNGAPGMPQAADVKLFRSWEIGFTFSYNFWKPYTKKAPFYFSAGVGLFWRSWRIKDGNMFMKNDNGNNVITTFPEGTSPKFSRIKVLSVSFPLLAHYWTKAATFAFGPVVNLNVKSSIKNKWETDGVEQKQYFNDIHVNPVTVDFICMIKFSNIGVYGKYSPCSMLDGKYGLKYKTFSFGLYL